MSARLLALALVLSACDPGDELPDAGRVDAGAVDAGPACPRTCGPNCSWSGEICEYRYPICGCRPDAG